MTQPVYNHPNFGSAPTASQLFSSMQKVMELLPPEPLMQCSFGGI